MTQPYGSSSIRTTLESLYVIYAFIYLSSLVNHDTCQRRSGMTQPYGSSSIRTTFESLYVIYAFIYL